MAARAAACAKLAGKWRVEDKAAVAAAAASLVTAVGELAVDDAADDDEALAEAEADLPREDCFETAASRSISMMRL